MRAAGSIVVIAVALTLQTTLDRFLTSGRVTVDLVLVAVMYVALSNGPGPGMFAGSVAGLIQDALAAPILGIGGLAKAIVGFFAGAFAQQFIVTAALPRLVIFVMGTIVHAAVYMGLYAVLNMSAIPSPWMTIAGQSVGNAIVGTIVFALAEAVPRFVERRRLGRRSRH